jgi:hypothetical protein
MGMARFVYRDHRTVGGRIARWIGIDDLWRMYADVFESISERGEKLLRDAGVDADGVC